MSQRLSRCRGVESTEAQQYEAATPLCSDLSPLPLSLQPSLLQLRRVPPRLLPLPLLLQIRPGQDQDQLQEQLRQLLALQGSTS